MTVHDAGDRPARLVGALAVVAPPPPTTTPGRQQPLADAATGLVSLELFVDRLDRAIRRRRRLPAYAWQVLAVRLPGGSTRSVRDRLRAELGEDDCATAVGTEGFAVLLDAQDGRAAQHRAARLAAVLGPQGEVRRVTTAEPPDARLVAADVLDRVAADLSASAPPRWQVAVDAHA